MVELNSSGLFLVPSHAIFAAFPKDKEFGIVLMAGGTGPSDCVMKFGPKSSKLSSINDSSMLGKMSALVMLKISSSAPVIFTNVELLLLFADTSVVSDEHCCVACDKFMSKESILASAFLLAN